MPLTNLDVAKDQQDNFPKPNPAVFSGPETYGNLSPANIGAEADDHRSPFLSLTPNYSTDDKVYANTPKYFQPKEINPRYNNYLLGQDNESINSELQTSWDKIGNASWNLVNKVGAYATQTAGFIGGALGATAGGITNLVDEALGGDGKVVNDGNAISYMTDNFLTNLGDLWKEKVQETNPIYKSAKYTNGNIWQKLATPDWWLDDGIDRLALTGAMLLPGFTEAKGFGLFGAIADEAGGLRATGAAAKAIQTLADNPELYGKIGKALGSNIYAAAAEGIADVSSPIALRFKGLIQAAQKAELYSWNVIGQSALNGREAQVGIKKALLEQREQGLNILTDDQIADKAAEGAVKGFWYTMPLSLVSSLVELPQIFSTAKTAESMLAKTFNKETMEVLEGALEKTAKPSIAKRIGIALGTALEHGQNESAQVAIGRYLEESIAGKIQNGIVIKDEGVGPGKTGLGSIIKNWIDNVNDPNGQNNIALGTIQGLLMSGGGSIIKSSDKLSKVLNQESYAQKDARNKSFIETINQATAKRRAFAMVEDLYEKGENGTHLINEDGSPKFNQKRLAEVGVQLIDAQKAHTDRLEAIRNGDTAKFEQLNFDSLSALAQNFFDDPKGMVYLTNLLKFEAKNQSQSLERINDTQNSEPLTPEKQLQKNIETVNKLKRAYDAIDQRHAGFTSLDIDESKPEEVRDKKEYLRAFTNAQYWNAAGQIHFNNVIARNNEELLTLGGIELIKNPGSPEEERINKLIVQNKNYQDGLTTLKNEYRVLIDKKQFKQGFEEFKKGNKTAQDLIDDIRENADKRSKIISIKQNDLSNTGQTIDKDLNLNQLYSLQESVYREDNKLILSPKIVPVTDLIGGLHQIVLPSGNVAYLTPDEFTKLNISDVDNDDESLPKIMDKSIDTVLKRDEFKGIELPSQGSDKLEYVNSLDNKELMDEVQKEFNIQAEQYITERKEAERKRQLLLKNQESIEKTQDEIENFSGSINTGTPDVDIASLPKEDSRKATDELFISITGASEKDEKDPKPHQIRARKFLNNIKNFKNNSDIKIILVTPKQQTSLGLDGLAELSYGLSLIDVPNALSSDSGFVGAVYVRQQGSKYFFVDENGDAVNEVGSKMDLDKVIFNTMPTVDLYWENGEPRYRAGEKEKATEQAAAWKVKRKELFETTEGKYKAYNFSVSRGIPISVDGEINHVGDTLVPEKKIETQEGLIQIATTGFITHQGKNLKFPNGRPVLQYGDTLQFLNNRTFSDKEAEAIFEVVNKMADEIVKQSETGKTVGINKAYAAFLQNVLYWKQSGKQQSNQIYINPRTMEFSLGGKTYNIADISNNKSEIIDQLKKTYSSVNNRTLKNFHEPFTEWYMKNGELVSNDWTNYQTYLLSSKFPNGDSRPIAETPLSTNVAKPTDAVPYNYQQKYSILQGLDLPIQKVDKKEKASDEIGDYKLDGKKENIYKLQNGDVKFTGTIDKDGNISVEVTPEGDTINKIVENKTLLNDQIIPALKAANIFDATKNDEQLVADFIGSRIVADLKTQQGPIEKTSIEESSKQEELSSEQKSEEPLDFSKTEAPDDDSQYRRTGKDSSKRMTDGEIELFKQWHAQNVSNIPYEVLDNIITTHDGEKAWGVFEKGVAKFYKGALKGTEYHEIGEGIWNGFLSPEEQQALINEFKSKSGSFIDRETGKKIDYNEATDLQAKERILDDFADFRLGKLSARTLGQKILKFFKSIIDFVKSFINKPSLKEELFKAIDTGAFKNRTLRKTVKNESAKYRAAENLTEEQTHEFIQDITARIFQDVFKNKSSLYNIGKITSSEMFESIKIRYQKEGKLEIMGDKTWNQLVRKTKEFLRTFKIEFDESDRLTINDEGSNKNDYISETFSTDWKKSSPYPIKLTLGTLTETEPTNQENSSNISLPTAKKSSIVGFKLLNFSRAFATAMDKLHNTVGVDSVIGKLIDLARADSNYVRLFTRLGGDLQSGTIDFSKFEKPEDWRLFVQFYKTFTKQKPDALIQYVKDGQVHTGAANLFTAVEQIKDGWIENIKALANTKGSIISYDKVNKVFKVDQSAISNQKIKTPQEMVEFLGKIGVDFPLEAYLKLKTDDQDKFGKQVGGIHTYLEKANNIATLSSDILGINGQLSKLSEMLVNVTNPNQDATFYNIDGKQANSFAENNSPSVFESEFNNANTLDELKQQRTELNDVFSKNSIILKKGGLFYNKEGERIKSFKVSYINGTQTDDKGISTSKLGLGDRFTQEINQNVNGNYYILIPADSSTEWMMNLGNHIKLIDFETERGWNNINKIFQGYLKDDVALALDDRKDIRNIGNKAQELRFFNDILSKKDKDGNETSDVLKGINELIRRGNTQEQIEDYINNEDIQKEINESVKNYIQNTVQETRKILTDNKQIINNGKDGYIYPMLDNTFTESVNVKLNKYNLLEDELNKLLTFVNTNYIINNIELHKILFGDPYQFAIKQKGGKTILDETKRIKSYLSPRGITVDFPAFNTSLNQNYNNNLKPGDYGYHTFKSYINTVTLKDVNINGRLMGKTNEADAASWIMDTTYREVKLKNGQWSNEEAEPWHQWQMAYTRNALAKKNEYTYSSEVLKKADEELLKKEEPKHTIEILKPIVSGNKYNKSNFDQVLDKFSQMPIYYKAVEGTNLEELYKKMFKEDIGYVIMESGRKVGAEKLYDLYDENGKLNKEPFNNKIQVPWKAYGIQVETSYEGPKFQTRGSQLTKIASTDLFKDGKSISETARQEYIRNTRILNEMHVNGYKELLNKLGIEDLGGSYKVNPKAVSEALEYEMLRRELSDNAKDTVQLDENGEFRIPFEASPAYLQIRSILYSMVDKAIGRPKLTGGGYVQAPVTMWESSSKGRRVEEINGKKVFTDDTLKFYENEDGKRYCEVMLPAWFKDKLSKGRFKTDKDILDHLNKTEEGRSILNGIGFRIPTQALSSAEVFKVKGFLPSFMGNTIVVPSEITTKAGSDFDIDKLNTYLKAVYLDKGGNIRLIKYQGNQEATKDFFGKVFDDKLANTIIKKNEILEALQIQNYDLDDPNGLVDKYSSVLDVLISSMGDINDTTDIEANLIKEIEILGDNNIQASFRIKFQNEMYKKALENEYYDSLEKLLTLPENFNRLTSSVDDGGLSDIADKLDDLMGYNESSIKNRILDRNYMTNQRHAFITGKKWVGIGAVNVTNQSLTQKGQVYINPARFYNEFDRKFLKNGSIILPHNTVNIDNKTYTSISGIMDVTGKKYISDGLSGYITAFVDVAKDPYILKIIGSDKVVGTAMFLQRIGVPLETAALFLNQPIIKEYLNYLDSTNQKGLFNKENISYIEEKFITTQKSIENAKINVDNLANNISDYYRDGKAKTDESNAVQYLILGEFLKYAKMAEYNFKMTQATNYDTTKFSSGDALLKKQMRTEKALYTNIFEGIDDILKRSFIGQQADVYDNSMEIMGEILKLEKDEFRDITDQILAPYAADEYLSADEYDKIGNKIKASFLDYTIQTKGEINEDVKSLLVNSSTSIDTQLAAAKKSHPQIKILRDFQIVSSDRVGGAKSIKLNANVNSAYDANLYTGMMRELRDTPGMNDLYNNIVKVGILQGIYKSAISINSIIPIEDYSKIITPIVNSIRNNGSLDSYLGGLFQRNNFNDAKIFKQIEPKFFSNAPFGEEHYPIGEDEFGNDIYQYLALHAFPTIENLQILSTDRKILLLDETYNSSAVAYDYVKFPRVITETRKGEPTGNYINVTNGQSISKQTLGKMKAQGDFSMNDIFGYQKVKYLNGEPVKYSFTNNKDQLETKYVYKLVNLYGDGRYASEYYEDFRPSVFNNGTVKIDNEIPDGDIIKFYGGDITKKISENKKSEEDKDLDCNTAPF